MKIFPALLMGALIGTALVTPVFAARGDVCLRNNRIWGWQAVNDRTLIVTDINYRRFTVDLTGGCVGLRHHAGVALKIRTRTRLGCLSQGDRIGFDSAGLGALSCTITEVRSGVPAGQAER